VPLSTVADATVDDRIEVPSSSHLLSGWYLTKKDLCAPAPLRETNPGFRK